MKPFLPEIQPLANAFVEKSPLPTSYTNVFRASGWAEERILDFGLDAHRRNADGGEPAVMRQRLVLTWGCPKAWVAAISRAMLTIWFGSLLGFA
jgi:hypothetical protein